MSNTNAHVVEALSKIAEVYRSQGVIYKYKAYRTAIDTIKNLHEPVTSSEQLKGAKGIGKAMLEKVDEILKTGSLAQEQQITADPINVALKLFTSIHGIGPVLARQLVDQGHRTLEDLETAHLPPAARMGLAHYADSMDRIPFDEVEVHLGFLRAHLHRTVDPELTPVVCGSHRRLGPTSGDIDVLLTHPASHSQSHEPYLYLQRAVEELRAIGYVTDVLAEGKTKFMGYAKLLSVEGARTRRLDMRWVPYDCFFPALLYFTGSDMFNVKMREDALKLGYTLNEYRLLRQADGVAMEVHSEEDIFSLLHRPYLPPVQRSK